MKSHPEAEFDNRQLVLVIDDDALVCRTVVRIVESAGLATISTHSGCKGISLASAKNPDIILCDVMMPDADGYTVLEKLQQNPETATIPFIFMTGKAEMDDLRKGMDLGADDYITKPFRREELIAAVQSRLTKRALLKKQAEAKMDQLRGKIMYVLPHELRTPLTAIAGLAELLAADAAKMPSERVQTIATGMVDSAARLSRIIENYLVYSQIELLANDPEHLQELKQERCDAPIFLLKELAATTAESAERRDDLLYQLCQERTIRISEDNLRKTIQELLDNAFKFSVAGTHVIVTAELHQDFLEIAFQDHGRGMSSAEIASIGAYNQFQRDQYEQPGTGLGLVIAHRMVDLHDGSFNIESTPHKGTTIRISLPYA